MFNTAFITALDALCAQHGVARNVKDGKITLIDSGSQEAQGRAILRMYGAHYGLTEDDYGATIISKGKRMKLVGLNTNAPRYPLHMENQADGAVWRFPRSFVSQIVAQRKAKPTAPVAAAPAQRPTTVLNPPRVGAIPELAELAGLAQF